MVAAAGAKGTFSAPATRPTAGYALPTRLLILSDLSKVGARDVNSRPTALRPRLPRNSSAAFTSTEIVVVILIAAVVLVLAWPALKDALNKRQMTRTMNHTRELYLAAFHMATDGAASKHVNYKWPGDYTVGVASLADYSSKLVQNAYLKPDDLERILSAPGAHC